MQILILCLLLLHTAGYADEHTEWLRNELQKGITSHVKIPLEGDIKKCGTNFSEVIDYKILIFVSFSMPDEALLAIGSEAERIGGVFVLRGIPNNSFPDLASRLLALRQKGLSVAVQIHPKLFEEYEVGAVPTYVLPGDGAFDKISGNISLEWALECFCDGDSPEKAAQILAELKEGRNDI